MSPAGGSEEGLTGARAAQRTTTPSCNAKKITEHDWEELVKLPCKKDLIITHQTMRADGTASLRNPRASRNASVENPVQVLVQRGDTLT
jgi:hypothetical protein